MYFQEMNDGLDPMQKEGIRSYLNRPDVMVLVKLRCNVTGQILTVGNIHVHWGKMKVPDVQCIQVSHKYPNNTFWEREWNAVIFWRGQWNMLDCNGSVNVYQGCQVLWIAIHL